MMLFTKSINTEFRCTFGLNSSRIIKLFEFKMFKKSDYLKSLF